MARAILLTPLTASLRTWGAKSITESADHVSMSTIAGGALDLSAVHVQLQDKGDDIGDISLPQNVGPLKDVQSKVSSWGQAHRDATGEEREAFELLFRCHIISAYEFAESVVPPEHIDECISIGLQMLCQKSLTDWIAISSQAKQAFEDHSAARFLARSDSRSSSFRSRTPTPEQIARQNPNTSSSLSSDSQPEAEKATPRMSIRVPRIDRPVSTGQQQKLFRPATQISRLDYPNAAEIPKNMTPRSGIHVPHVDLSSLGLAKEQSYQEDDDDPYTTRSTC